MTCSREGWSKCEKRWYVVSMVWMVYNACVDLRLALLVKAKAVCLIIGWDLAPGITTSFLSQHMKIPIEDIESSHITFLFHHNPGLSIQIQFP